MDISISNLLKDKDKLLKYWSEIKLTELNFKSFGCSMNNENIYVCYVDANQFLNIEEAFVGTFKKFVFYDMYWEDNMYTDFCEADWKESFNAGIESNYFNEIDLKVYDCDEFVNRIDEALKTIQISKDNDKDSKSFLGIMNFLNRIKDNKLNMKFVILNDLWSCLRAFGCIDGYYFFYEWNTPG